VRGKAGRCGRWLRVANVKWSPATNPHAARSSAAPRRLSCSRALPRLCQKSVHDALLAKFLTAAESGDIAELASMLAADVLMRGDGGPASPGLKKPLRGRHEVAQFIVASRALLPEGATFSPERLNGGLAALFRAQGVPVLAIIIECTEEQEIGTVFAIANPEKLKAIGSR
jgi:hypothetical protein